MYTEEQQRRLRNAVTALYGAYGTRSTRQPITSDFRYPTEKYGGFRVNKVSRESIWGKVSIQFYVDGGIVHCCHHAAEWDNEYYDLSRWEKS